METFVDSSNINCSQTEVKPFRKCFKITYRRGKDIENLDGQSLSKIKVHPRPVLTTVMFFNGKSPKQLKKVKTALTK